MKENKQYKLKRWYPSLPAALKKEMVVEFNGSSIRWVDGCIEYNHEINELELKCTDFWEEVKQPLFVTEDGFKFFGETNREFYIVVDFIKYKSTISDFEDQKKLPHKVFYHEATADEYIAWYKKEFSINDLLLADVGITTSQLHKLQELVKKKRSK